MEARELFTFGFGPEEADHATSGVALSVGTCIDEEFLPYELLVEAFLSFMISMEIQH